MGTLNHLFICWPECSQIITYLMLELAYKKPIMCFLSVTPSRLLNAHKFPETTAGLVAAVWRTCLFVYWSSVSMALFKWFYPPQVSEISVTTLSVRSPVRLKCPLRSTNKRFLLNTLRSTGLQRRAGEPTHGHSAARGRLRSDSPDRSRDRSRTPPRDQRSNGGRADHKHHHRDSYNNKDKKRDRDKERSQMRKDNTDRRRGRDGHHRGKDWPHEERLLSRGGAVPEAAPSPGSAEVDAPLKLLSDQLTRLTELRAG